MKKLDYIKNNRGLKFVEIGMKVEFLYTGQIGIIKGENRSGNLDVLFEGEKVTSNCHPTWKMRYFDRDGNVIAEYND